MGAAMDCGIKPHSNLQLARQSVCLSASLLVRSHVSLVKKHPSVRSLNPTPLRDRVARGSGCTQPTSPYLPPVHPERQHPLRSLTGMAERRNRETQAENGRAGRSRAHTSPEQHVKHRRYRVRVSNCGQKCNPKCLSQNFQ